MPNEEDDIQYRRQISELLVKHGFDWVVAQAEFQIAEGTPSIKQVSDVKDIPDTGLHTMAEYEGEVSAAPRGRSKLITSKPYSESEKLDILLAGIHSAIVERSNLEEAILEMLPEIENITFVPDLLTEEYDTEYLGRRHVLDRLEEDRRQQIRQSTESALKALGESRSGRS